MQKLSCVFTQLNIWMRSYKLERDETSDVLDFPATMSGLLEGQIGIIIL